MAYQPLEQLLPRAAGSIYKLILLASKRALELADGLPPLIDFPSQKTATIALDEILAGKVETKESAEIDEKARKAKKEDK
ncbi:MAG: DNA-directed RNA polymerase subunit omega [Candidatus Omnitrophota bacterium]